jgi:hypothetical protein
MTAIEKPFWRDFWPLLLGVSAAQLAQQADMVMMGRLGGGAPGAYAMLTRLAIVDIVLMTAIGSVASTKVAEAQRKGDVEGVVAPALGFTLLAGLFCSALGMALYSSVARWIVGDGEVATLVATGVFWYSYATPFRFLSNTSAFVLHALGDGAAVLRWKLIEFGAKLIGNLIALEALGWGFGACFLVGATICIASSLWGRFMLSERHRVGFVAMPDPSWARRFLGSIVWESQRVVALHLTMLACLALFAAQWLGRYDVARLDAYAAGQTLMTVVFTPIVTLMRFLAFRFAGLHGGRLAATTRMVIAHGAPVAVGAGLLLAIGHESLGRLYGQQGPWWSMLALTLAASIPLRFMAMILRAIVQSQGAYSTVAMADSIAFGALAPPLVAIGLAIDSPLTTYLSLTVPEAASAAWLWGRLRFDGSRANGAKELSSPKAE